MGKLTLDITMSLDGFVAGPNQTIEQPLGEGGERLHEWVYGLATWRESHGRPGGETNADGPRGRGAPRGADQAPRAGADGTCQPALRSGGEPARGGACGGFGVRCLESEHAKCIMPRDERGPTHAGGARRFLPEPGPGWHGFPRRVVSEHAKQVAEIVDLLGAGEKFPQHHGPLWLGGEPRWGWWVLD